MTLNEISSLTQATVHDQSEKISFWGKIGRFFENLFSPVTKVLNYLFGGKSMSLQKDTFDREVEELPASSTTNFAHFEGQTSQEICKEPEATEKPDIEEERAVYEPSVIPQMPVPAADKAETPKVVVSIASESEEVVVPEPTNAESIIPPPAASAVPVVPVAPPAPEAPKVPVSQPASGVSAEGLSSVKLRATPPADPKPLDAGDATMEAIKKDVGQEELSVGAIRESKPGSVTLSSAKPSEIPSLAASTVPVAPPPPPAPEAPEHPVSQPAPGISAENLDSVKLRTTPLAEPKPVDPRDATMNAIRVGVKLRPAKDRILPDTQPAKKPGNNVIDSLMNNIAYNGSNGNNNSGQIGGVDEHEWEEFEKPNNDQNQFEKPNNDQNQIGKPSTGDTVKVKQGSNTSNVPSLETQQELVQARNKRLEAIFRANHPNEGENNDDQW